MPSTRLRKVGGSIMMTVPPSILDRLDLRAGAEVDLQVDDDRLIVKPRARPRYKLDELLAQCGASARISKEDREWLDDAPAGRELL
jgi:antitoxin ChpS